MPHRRSAFSFDPPNMLFGVVLGVGNRMTWHDSEHHTNFLDRPKGSFGKLFYGSSSGFIGDLKARFSPFSLRLDGFIATLCLSACVQEEGWIPGISVQYSLKIHPPAPKWILMRKIKPIFMNFLPFNWITRGRRWAWCDDYYYFNYLLFYVYTAYTPVIKINFCHEGRRNNNIAIILYRVRVRKKWTVYKNSGISLVNLKRVLLLLKRFYSTATVATLCVERVDGCPFFAKQSVTEVPLKLNKKRGKIWKWF